VRTDSYHGSAARPLNDLALRVKSVLDGNDTLDGGNGNDFATGLFFCEIQS
jgi:hypothetical protein